MMGKPEAAMSADSNLKLIERFYAAFDAGDGKVLAACHAPGVSFSDPVFPDLKLEPN